MRGIEVKTPLANNTKTKGRSYADRGRSKVGCRRDRNAQGCIEFDGKEQEQQVEKKMRSLQLSLDVCLVPTTGCGFSLSNELTK
jgi:hypothetical protein